MNEKDKEIIQKVDKAVQAAGLSHNMVIGEPLDAMEFFALMRKMKEAREKALAEGKSKDEAWAIAGEAFSQFYAERGQS